jgi:hypothetical protein
MIKAICIRCGTSKEAPWRKCRKCGLSPLGDDLAKSVYCSLGRFNNDEDQSAQESELKSLSTILKQGGTIDYNTTELERLKLQQTQVGSVSWTTIMFYLFRVFLPAILFLTLLFLLVAYLKR